MSKHFASLIGALLISQPAFAAQSAEKQSLSDYQRCLLEAYQQLDQDLSLEAVQIACQQTIAEQQSIEISEAQPRSPAEAIVFKRIAQEQATAFNPFVITPHRMNYILPFTYTDDLNEAAYQNIGWQPHLRNAEAKFQLSLKVPINTGDMLFAQDKLYFGFTIKSYWQVYAENISRPFRETNYRPELFYITPTQWQPFGGNTWLKVGFEHESNGRSQILSRSWNRAYFNFIYAKDDFAIGFQPWYRIPEDEKEFIGDPEGDDNPDIHQYMGHFELTTAYKWRQFEFNSLFRQNFATHRGYAELGFTFPIWGRLNGYIQYTTGYGDSLIDYNINQNRIGIGIALTDLL